MPFLLSEKSNNSVLYLWELSEDVENFRSKVSSTIFKSIVDNTKLDKRKLEKLSQVMLIAKAGLDYSQVTYLSNGKPMTVSNKHISFSHSGILSSLLVDNNTCGVDLEYPSEKVLRISSRFIHAKEMELMKNEKNMYWTWSIKEAIFKFFGEKVTFKEDIHVVDIQESSNKAIAIYSGFHGKGIFELKLLRVKKYYLAYTKSYTPE